MCLTTDVTVCVYHAELKGYLLSRLRNIRKSIFTYLWCAVHLL